MGLQELDSSNGALLPFYDPDTNVVYVCGKVRPRCFPPHPPYTPRPRLSPPDAVPAGRLEHPVLRDHGGAALHPLPQHLHQQGAAARHGLDAQARAGRQQVRDRQVGMGWGGLEVRGDPIFPLLHPAVTLCDPPQVLQAARAQV